MSRGEAKGFPLKHRYEVRAGRNAWPARWPIKARLFAALLAHARAHVDGDSFFAPVAGALLGLLLFLRFDAVLGVAGVLAALALGIAWTAS